MVLIRHGSNKGTQGRFPPKHIEMSFYAIKSTLDL